MIWYGGMQDTWVELFTREVWKYGTTAVPWIGSYKRRWLLPEDVKTVIASRLGLALAPIRSIGSRSISARTVVMAGER